MVRLVKILFLLLLSACQVGSDNSNSNISPADSSTTTSTSASAVRYIPKGTVLNSNYSFSPTAQTYAVDVQDLAGRDVQIDTEGRIWVTGRHSNGTDDDMFIARLTSSGAWDSGFNSTGFEAVTFGTGGDLAHAIALDDNGGAVIVGRTDPLTNFYFDFGIASFLENGSLNSNFGSGTGKVVEVFGGSTDIARDVRIQPDGKIIVAGYHRHPHHTFPYEFAVLRMNTDGSLDSSFGTAGKATVATTVTDNGAVTMALQDDGKIILAGTYWDGTYNNISIVRYDTNGVLDTSFSGDGILNLDIGTKEDLVNAVAVDAQGRIVCVGSKQLDSNLKAPMILRLLSDGTLDTNFGTNGVLVVSDVTGNSYLTSVMIDYHDGIIAGGTLYSGSGNIFALIHLNESGSVDSALGTNGYLTKSFYGNSDIAESISCLTDGHCVALGRAKNTTTNKLELAVFPFSLSF